MKLRYTLLLVFLLTTTFSYSQNRKRYIYTPKSEKNSSNKNIGTKLSDMVPASEKKEIYRIDILLPIHLDLLPHTIQHVKSWPQSALAGMNFYEGVLMAVDSLEKNEDIYYDIYIHDIASIDLDSLLKTEDLKSSDVVIAGVQSQQLEVVSQFALDNKINTFSVFSPAEGSVRNNPFFFLFQPTLSTHLSHAIDYAETQFGRYPTTVLYRETSGDEIAFTMLKSSLRRRYKEYKIHEDAINIEELKSKLVKKERNLIYTTFISPESAQNILTQLAELPAEYEILVIGLPSWKSLNILTNNTLPEHITVILPYAFQYDTDESLKLFVHNQYNKYQRGFPTEFTFRGYESVLWIAQQLQENGIYFNQNTDIKHTVSTDFHYKLSMDNGQMKFFENKNIYLFKYNSGKFDIIK